MKRYMFVSIASVLFAGAAQVQAQEPVVGVADPEALFHNKNPALEKNLQAAYHIQKNLLECREWDKADQWLTERYIQHNPNAKSGRAGVVYYFTQVLKFTPKPCPEKMESKIVAVVAQGDRVIVVTPREYKNPTDPSKSYSTTWFDMWRFVDGKADEHWDPAQLSPPPAAAPPAAK
jgi:predicted SnoaL-like aldol condensation-catalyzing enzyme